MKKNIIPNSKTDFAKFVAKSAINLILSDKNNKQAMENYQLKLNYEKKLLKIDKKINELNYKIKSLKNKLFLIFIVMIVAILYFSGIIIK